MAKPYNEMSEFIRLSLRMIVYGFGYMFLKTLSAFYYSTIGGFCQWRGGIDLF